jgi:hypothetical protein
MDMLAFDGPGGHTSNEVLLQEYEQHDHGNAREQYPRENDRVVRLILACETEQRERQSPKAVAFD